MMNISKKYAFLFGCIIVQSFVSVCAQSLSGSQSFPIMSMNYSAQAIGMGGSALAMRQGEMSNVLENPCLLDSIDRKKASLHFMRYLAKSNGLQACYVDQIDSSQWRYAAGIKSLGYGELNRYDATGVSQGTFHANDYLIQAVASRPVDSLLTIGIGYKLAFSQYDVQRAAAMGFDFSGMYHWPKSRLTMTALLRNVGFPLNKSNGGISMSVPFDLQFGISKKPKNAPFTYSVIYRTAHKWDLTNGSSSNEGSVDPITGEVVGNKRWVFGDQLMRHLIFGVDCKLGSALHFYLGYNYGKRVELKNNIPGLTGISWGTSLLMKRWQFQYAGARWHSASTIHTIGIAFLPFSKL